MEKEIKKIEMSKIDFNAITKIREIDERSANYQKLHYSIENDGQHNPIVVRELMEEERKENKEALYGIIDGHHRFHIAEKMGITEIAAIIEEKINDKCNRDRNDKILAFRLNETSIKMSAEDKGKVIYELLKDTDNSQEDKKAVTGLGKEIFGLGKAMSYRCLQKYKKSISEETIEKPRKEVQFSPESLTEAMKRVAKIFSDKMPNDVKEEDEYLEAVNDLIEQLKTYKSTLKENNKKKKLIDENSKEEEDENKKLDVEVV